MKNTLLLALIFISFVSEGQIKRISLRAGANYTSIKNVLVHEDLVIIAPYSSQYPPTAEWVEAGFEHTFDSKAGAEFGGVFDCTIKGRLLLTTGLSVSLIRFQKKSPKILYGQNGSNTGFLMSFVPKDSYHGELYPSPYFYPTGPYLFIYSTEKTGETSIASVQVPVLVGVSLLKNKLLIRAGGTISFVAYSSEYKVKFSGADYQDKKSENINKVFTSATANVTYLITKKIGIDVTGNYSLQSIYKNTTINTTVYSLGVTYSMSK